MVFRYLYGMKRIFLIFILIVLSIPTLAQVSGRMREKKNQKRLLRQIKYSGWRYKKTPKCDRRETKFLYKWNVTKGKKYKRKVLKKLNRDRTRRRIRGNNVFHKKKYSRF